MQKMQTMPSHYVQQILTLVVTVVAVDRGMPDEPIASVDLGVRLTRTAARKAASKSTKLQISLK